MLLKNIINVITVFHAVPDTIWINHYSWAKFATIKATSRIDSDIQQPQLLNTGFHIITQFNRAAIRAGTARVLFLALVYAAKNMQLIKAHLCSLGFLAKYHLREKSFLHLLNSFHTGGKAMS
jgi:hypothetical protein